MSKTIGLDSFYLHILLNNFTASVLRFQPKFFQSEKQKDFE